MHAQSAISHSGERVSSRRQHGAAVFLQFSQRWRNRPTPKRLETPPGDAAAQQPETLAAQIAQHLLTALQGGSQPPLETGMSPFSTFPIPFHPVGVNNAELARIIGD